MSANALTRVNLTDDDGSGTTGTVLNDALFQSVQAAVDAAIGQVVQTKSANYTALVTDDVILGTSTWTLSLYAAAGNAGRTLDLVNTGTGIITVDPNAAETIGGAATYTLDGLRGIRIRCDGSNWAIVASTSGGTFLPSNATRIAMGL
jgi:hypothetical protein